MDLRHAILGLLSLRPMSGYDLGRAFADSVAHFWHADQSQIYRTLDRLHEAGAIETTVIAQDGKPDRKVHSLTGTGHAELSEWLASPIDRERPKEPFLARLFFAAPLGRDAVDRLLAEREQQVEETAQALGEVEVPGDDLASELRAATLGNGLAHAEAEREWLRTTRLRLSERES